MKKTFTKTPESEKFWPVFLEITVEGNVLGKIILELFDDCPITAKNFTCLCTGEKGIGKSGKPLHYKGSIFHRIESEFLA
jgi:peptidyl-prolyl isomerase D